MERCKTCKHWAPYLTVRGPMPDRAIARDAKHAGGICNSKNIKEEWDDVFAPNMMVYEYMDKAGPMAIDGMPMFCSFRFLNQEDAKKVYEKYIQIKEAIEKV